jgi:hypothetical protein
MDFPILPTWRAFLDRLAVEYGVELFDASQDPHPPGYPAAGCYLTRRWKDARIFVMYSPSGLLDDEMLPGELDLLCVRLQIDPKDFGLVLH